MANKAIRSLNAHKGHMTRNLEEAEAAVESLLQYKSSTWQDKVDKIWDKKKKRMETMEELFEKLHDLDPEQSASYTEQEEQIGKDVNKMSKQMADARKKIAKSVNSPPPTEGTGSGSGCKPNKELKPSEELQLQDNPVKLRRWKEEFRTYYTSSNMDKANLQERQQYFLKCLGQSLREKVKKQIENLPIFSNDGDVETCYTTLDKVFLQEYPLVKRRQEFFELTRVRPLETSRLMDQPKVSLPSLIVLRPDRLVAEAVAGAPQSFPGLP